MTNDASQVADDLKLSFPGSAWERTTAEALPPEPRVAVAWRVAREAEPRRK
jgi:hypothetical protein